MPKAAISVAGSDQIVKQIRDPLILDLRPHDMAAKSVANTIKIISKNLKLSTPLAISTAPSPCLHFLFLT